MYGYCIEFSHQQTKANEMKFNVSIISTEGYEFNHGFDTLAAAREFIALASLVIVPGERIELTQEA